MSDLLEFIVALGRLLTVLIIVRWLFSKPIQVTIEFEGDGD